MARSRIAERKRRAKRLNCTKSTRTFVDMRRWNTDRVTIVSEGDSWFAYPPEWLIGKPSNLIAHITAWTTKRANFLTMASNGDEAVDMVSGKQKHELVDILRWHEGHPSRTPVDLLLFSGGGNDLVGENDFERFLNAYENGFTARNCVNTVRLRRKVKQIGLAVEELLDIRDHYSPSTVVMTHAYDYPYPSLQGGVFLGGLIKTKGWMKRFMDRNEIPEALQADIIKIFMKSVADEFVRITARRSGFTVVETRGTLEGKERWLNEIHPDSEGFEMLARPIHAEMLAQFPGLQ